MRNKKNLTAPLRSALLLTVLLTLTAGSAMQAQNKKKADNKATTPKVAIVDDEECGCELFFVDGIQTIRRDGLFGFKLEDGTVIVKPQYMFVDRFQDGFCIVYHNYDSCGVINRQGREVVPAIYAEVSQPSDGMIRVKKDNLYGFFDTLGHLCVDFQYRAASGFFEGLAAVLVDHDSNFCDYGYIDHQGRMKLPAQYEYAFPFHEGYAVVKKYDRYGMIDTNGNEVLPTKYGEVATRTDGCVFVSDDVSGKIAMFNSKFKQVTPFIYDGIAAYAEGYFTVVRNGQCTFLDTKGKECFGLYEDAGKFKDGYVMVKRNGRYGIIDKRGKTVLPFEYDNSGYHASLYVYYEGLAMVERDGRYGFVDTDGKMVIPLINESAHHCTEGLIPVKRNGKWGYIDTKGADAIAFEFEEASYFEWGRAEVLYNGVTYKINPQGQCVKNCKTFPKIWHR